MSEESRSFSLLRILLIAVPAAVAAWAVKSYTDGFQQAAHEQSVKTTVRQMLGQATAFGSLSDDYQDEDGDLVADPPQDLSACLNPEEIRFSYIASTEEGNQQETWREFTEQLSQRLGRPVKFIHFADIDEQLRDLKEGQLHITAFGTGAVPTAVNRSGFTPLYCFASADGEYGYTMKVIVPSDSEIKDLEQLRGKRVTYTRPRSNSGYKAAMVLLMEKYDLQPERDYKWGFSYGHDNSIHGVARQEYEAAAVASDVLERMIALGEVNGDAIRVIYESDPFPPGVIGYAYNLTPELREGIRETFLGFQTEGTALAEKFGAGDPVQFASVSYKDDWAPVRQINDVVNEVRAQLE